MSFKNNGTQTSQCIVVHQLEFQYWCIPKLKKRLKYLKICHPVVSTQILSVFDVNRACLLPSSAQQTANTRRLFEVNVSWKKKKSELRKERNLTTDTEICLTQRPVAQRDVSVHILVLLVVLPIEVNMVTAVSEQDTLSSNSSLPEKAPLESIDSDV